MLIYRVRRTTVCIKNPGGFGVKTRRVGRARAIAGVVDIQCQCNPYNILPTSQHHFVSAILKLVAASQSAGPAILFFFVPVCHEKIRFGWVIIHEGAWHREKAQAKLVSIGIIRAAHRYHVASVHSTQYENPPS